MIDITPLNDNVLIMPAEKAEKIGSFFVPKTTAEREAPVKGTVVELPAGVDDIAQGQVVHYKKYAAVEVVIDNEHFVLVPYEDLVLKEGVAHD